jgi:hypothetical protein
VHSSDTKTGKLVERAVRLVDTEVLAPSH